VPRSNVVRRAKGRMDFGSHRPNPQLTQLSFAHDSRRLTDLDKIMRDINAA